ncbi:unnamed protein product [Notodromas monacha]|uniref:Integrin alpha first immunoglubulin-like domain-containing protein n=1 Tax=Notodromas monacha TaxID=399045 RepID=A0A7R9BH78_9CRUS|nr:unnamed protein product [Notodromas monacha]CAG0915436.1 unnamed protein product [Notodromas monacha]
MKSGGKLIFDAFVIVIILKSIDGFNLDVSSPVIFEDPGTGGKWNQRQSYFGYSIALHNNSGSNPGASPITWVLVGAPRANRSNPAYPTIQQGSEPVVEPGALYKCTLWADVDSCTEVILDRTEFQTVDMHPPNKKNEYVYALGQAGTSVHFPDDPSQVVLGAPGMFSWRGSIVRIQDRLESGGAAVAAAAAVSSSTSSSAMHRNYTEVTTSQGKRNSTAASGSFVETRAPWLFYTPNVLGGDFWGYSVSSGIFLRDRRQMYVAGGPRAGWTGKVFIFSYPEPGSDKDPLIVRWAFSGTQGGEYFGGAICVVDVNSDGLDDLLIGAPLNSVAQDNTVYPDQGRVYVYINHNENFADMADKQLTSSTGLEARFGLAISAIGDIDRDGFNDVAIGAPYENDGHGAVYIYLGSKAGLTTASQIIQGISISKQMFGFGISISRGIDMDRNNYPDIGVGAFSSGHAVVLRSRPVVVISGSLTPSTHRISINDTDKSIGIEACVTFSGKDAPNDIDVSMGIQTDVRYSIPRVKFVSGDSQISYKVTLNKDAPACEKFKLVFVPYVKDFSKALEIRLKFEQIPRPRIQPFVHLLRAGPALGEFCKSCAVADPRVQNQANLEPAFVPLAKIEFNKYLTLVSLPRNCREDKFHAEKTVVECELPGPMYKGARVDMTIGLDLTMLRGDMKELRVNMSVTSISDEHLSTRGDNSYSLVVPLEARADIAIQGQVLINPSSA